MRTAKQLFEIFEKYVKEDHFNSSPPELYEPVHYIMNLGGKRMRPVLVLMACDIFEGDIQEALPAAYAVELFHNFTLMHDDIMDHAPLRRGKPTVHEKFTEGRAILSGDVMLIYVYEFLKKLHDKKFRKVLDIFNEVSIKVCEGQQYDLNFQQQDNVTIEDYVTMIEYKTAALLAGSLKIGASIAGAREEDAGSIYSFGKNIGIGFQLMDDLLDTFGDQEKTGKKTGGDITENKKTYLLLKTAELADDFHRKELEFYLTNNVPHDKKISSIKSIMKQFGVDDLVREQIKSYHQKALTDLNSLDIPEDRKAVLQDYADKLAMRQF